MWGHSETRGNMSAYFAKHRTADSCMHPTWGSFGGAKPRRIIAACNLLPENQRWQGPDVG